MNKPDVLGAFVVCATLAACAVDPTGDATQSDVSGAPVEGVSEVTQELVSPGLPNPGAHNTLFTRTFTKNGESCSFSFMYGNFGVGYTQVRVNSAGCGEATTTVISGNFDSDFARALPGTGTA